MRQGMSPEAESLNLEAFDDAFFAQLEQEFEPETLQTLAMEALEDVLTVEREDGTRKTFEDILEEADAYFSNPMVQEDMAILNAAAARFAQFAHAACGGHEAASSLLQSNEGLSDVYGRGAGALEAQADHAGHAHEAESTNEEDKKKTKTKSKRTGWLSILFAR